MRTEWIKTSPRSGLCATDGCERLASWRMEAGDVGSHYCSRCKSQIEFDAKEHNYLELTGYRRGDRPS